MLESLNPYSIGIWSATYALYNGIDCWHLYVLILILLEYGLQRV